MKKDQPKNELYLLDVAFPNMPTPHPMNPKQIMYMPGINVLEHFALQLYLNGKNRELHTKKPMDDFGLQTTQSEKMLICIENAKHFIGLLKEERDRILSDANIDSSNKGLISQ